MAINGKAPLIGILCWEEGSSPRGLAQLEELIGNSTNPETFDFPITYARVKGANIHTVLENPCRDTLEAMINEARKMEKDGIKAITTSCGFNAVFQKELSDSVRIPVFTSSLMQVPLVRHMLTSQQSVGIITAQKKALSKKHLENAGVTESIPVRVQGLEDCAEWHKIFSSPEADIDIPVVAKDIVSRACAMMKTSDIGAFVLECTDLPPFSDEIRNATGRPVFDFVTLTKFVYQGICSQYN